MSRPVVQGLPSANSQRLNAALARIGRDPRDYLALIDAGDAANALGDPEAAAGFYKRADGISPNNPRIKAGLARALVLQGNPIEAIPLFAVAEAGGAGLDVTADRGLAYDLVGDPVTAQRYYQAAIARRDDDEVRRRLGVSLAIVGDAAGSDAMLMPLLRKQDKPAWRAHAFALAIAGKTKEAVDTVNAILPGPLAQSVTPYLRYMPRLTRSQQAAAVNLGKFPRASEIGRDDPAIAAYVPATTQMASADARLIPRGRALGGGKSRTASASLATPAPLTGSERRARDKAARLARAEAAEAARVAPPEPMPAIGRDDGDGELPAVASSTPMPMASVAPAAPSSRLPVPTTATASMPTRTLPVRTAAAPFASTPAGQQVPTTSLAQARSSGPAVVRTGSLALSEPSQTRRDAPSSSAAVASAAAVQREPVRSATSAFDLADLSRPASSSPVQPLAPTAPAAQAAAAPTAVPPSAGQSTSSGAVSLEQVFADLGAPSRAPAPVAGAVDVRAIEPAKARPAPALQLAGVEPEVAAPATGKAAARKHEAPHAAPEGELAVDKKKGIGGKDAKLADAKTAKSFDARNAKLVDAKSVDAKGGDLKKVDGKKGDAKLADAKKAEAKKAIPSHPSRIWVQVGVGRDKAAIGYDWRKFVKDNPALFKGRQPYTSDMGRTNRILAGPFETQKAAADLTAKLKKADVGGAFVWTSPAGQVVDALPVK